MPFTQLLCDKVQQLPIAQPVTTTQLIGLTAGFRSFKRIRIAAGDIIGMDRLQPVGAIPHGRHHRCQAEIVGQHVDKGILGAKDQ